MPEKEGTTQAANDMNWSATSPPAGVESNHHTDTMNSTIAPPESPSSSTKPPLGSEADLTARSESIASESQPTNFFSLSRELRDIIYSHAVLDTSIVHTLCYGRHPAWDCPLPIRTYGALMATSKETRAEVPNIFFKGLRKGGNLFLIEDGGHPLLNGPSGKEGMEVVGAGFEREVWLGKGPDERDLKGYVGTRVRLSGCYCPIVMPYMPSFEVLLSPSLHARVYRSSRTNSRIWKAKWIHPRRFLEAFEAMAGRPPKITTWMKFGDKFLEEFRGRVEGEDGLEDEALLKFTKSMQRLRQRTMMTY